MDQLIDSDSQWWNTSLVDSIFIPSETQQIKSILVCHSAQKDFCFSLILGLAVSGSFGLSFVM